MHVFGAFELEIRPGSPDDPAGVKIVLLRYAGSVRMLPIFAKAKLRVCFFLPANL